MYWKDILFQFMDPLGEISCILITLIVKSVNPSRVYYNKKLLWIAGSGLPYLMKLL